MRKTVLLSSALLALLASCGESDSKLGDDLAKAGDKMKEAGEDMADDAMKAGKEAMANATSKLDSVTKDLSAGLSLKGDELAKMLQGKMPDLEKLYEQAKAALAGKGDSMKGAMTDLTSSWDTLKAKLADLTKGGAGATDAVKKAVMDAFASFSTKLKESMTKAAG